MMNVIEQQEVTTPAYDKKQIRNRNYPVSHNHEYCEYLGYVFSSDGMVFSPAGNSLIPMKNEGLDYVTLIVNDQNNKRHLVRVSLEHACFSMFARSVPEDFQKQFLESPENAYVKSMEKPPRRRKASSKTGRTKKFSKEEAARLKKDYVEYGATYRELAKKYNTCVVTIQKIVKGIY